jgi:histidyl-tRNA synthetase
MAQYLSTQPYKGTRDFYPEDLRIQHWMFSRLKDVLKRWGYQEYDGPMLEPFELYAAKSGEELVNQQLYWLIDRGERKLAVRPEMTPTMARMVAGKYHELPKPVRWFSIPNLWRYERPQRGRLREHWQLNVDVLGGDRTLADGEIVQVALELMKEFGGEKFVAVRVNNRKLMDHFFGAVLGLNAEAALKVSKAIDAREKIGEEAYIKWLADLGISESTREKMEAFFRSRLEQIHAQYECPGSHELNQLFVQLKEAGFEEQVVFDPLIMRGLDYYTGTVFEIFDISPENRRALFGGGRYDNLLGLFGNFSMSGIGFGMGDVGLRNFIETHGLLPSLDSGVDVLVTLPKREALGAAQEVCRELRARGLSVMTPLEVGGFGAQLKLADKHRARFVVLLGELELSRGCVVVKELKTGTQTEISRSDWDALARLCGASGSR